MKKLMLAALIAASAIAPNLFAAKPQIDCSKIRGVCYCTSMRNLPEVKRNLGYGKRVSLNSVRFWLSQQEYEKRGQAYVDEIVAFIRTCHECGYSSMPILFNGNMLNPATVQPDAYAKADTYAKAVVNAVKNEPGLLMWDIMNEPLCNHYISDAPKKELEKRQGEIWAFLRHEIETIQGIAPDNLLTIGYTTSWEIEESTASKLDVLSFHDYSDSREHARNNCNNAMEWSKKLNKPVMNTETGCIGRANSYEMALEIANEYKMGWYLFCLMIEGYWNEIHGIFYNDGTIRDAGTIAALCGCYRNRGKKEPIVLPNANRENKVSSAVNGIREALKDNSADGFAYSHGDKKKLLDACEVAANILEGCELIPMSELPTTKILKYRKDEKADLMEIRRFAYDLANKLKEVAQLL